MNRFLLILCIAFSSSALAQTPPGYWTLQQKATGNGFDYRTTAPINTGFFRTDGSGNFNLSNAATTRTALGVSIGSDVQAYSANLSLLSALTIGANQFIVRGSSGPVGLKTVTDAALNLLSDADLSTTNGIASSNAAGSWGVTIFGIYSINTNTGNSVALTSASIVANGNTFAFPSASGTLATTTDIPNATTLLDTITSTQGAILYRGASGWTSLNPGTSGYALVSNGTGADPSYQAVTTAPGGSAGYVQVNNGSGGFTGTSGLTFNSGALVIGGQSLTGSQATNALGITSTWNTSGSPSLIYGRVTNTASSAASRLISVGTVVGGEGFGIDVGGMFHHKILDGGFTIGTFETPYGPIVITTGGGPDFKVSTSVWTQGVFVISDSSGATRTVLQQDASGQFAVRDGAVACSIRAYAGSNYASLAHNGTNAILSTTAGTMNIQGNIALDKTITAGGTTGAQTINKTSGSVNFAAAATSLVVTNSLCTTSSVILVTIAANDSTASNAKVVAGSGSFTIYLGVAPTSETRVNFLITN